MNPLSILTGYIGWHYGAAFVQIVKTWKNIYWFVMNFFSVTMLLKTLFAPWKRIQEDYQKGFHPEAFFESLMVNILGRLVGAFIRIWVILISIVVMLAVALGEIIFLVFWAVAPVVVGTLIVVGFVLLFSF